MKNLHDKPKILIVDDVPGNIKMLKVILETDYKLFIALNGSNALEIAASKPIDLILLDIIMPVMDGYEVCRRLQANASTSGIPVIFVTGQRDEMVTTDPL
jgi:two-component system, sensor histidine kinase and response regulator